MHNTVLTERLIKRTRRLKRLARKIKWPEERVAERAIEIFGEPEKLRHENAELHHLITATAEEVRTHPRLVVAAVVIPDDRLSAFAALVEAEALRERIYQEVGPVGDSTPLIREDRDR